MAKTVWILGSGFSKSLGGPLLNDLLSDRSGGEARQRLIELSSAVTSGERLMMDRKGGELAPDYGLVYKIYAEHLRGNDASKGKAVHWEHAEEFLTFVDSTSDDAPRRALLKSWLPSDRNGDEGTDWFRRAVVSAIASECNFVQTASVKRDETWRPYIRWGSERATADDSIVTFNYDLVLETLGDSQLAAPVSRKGVATPGKPKPLSGYVPIYKLHGSVNWFVNHNGTVHDDGVDIFRSTISNHTPLIGTPGVSKRTVRDKFLDSIWEEAKKALTEAEVVVFLGYRSPPSDPDARQFILDAISTPEAVRGAPRHRRVHLVLGPNTHDPAVTRLEKLIEFSMAPHGRIKRYILGHSKNTPRYEVLKQPLYVEDFLSACPKTELDGTRPEDD